MLKRVPLKKSIKPLKKGKPLSRRKKSPEEIAEEKKDSEKMTAFFIDCQKILGKRSDISDTLIGNVGRGNYHHLLEKNDNAYPELKYSFNNIIICTIQEHDEIHQNPTKYEIVQQKLNFIKNNWEFCIQQGNSWSTSYDKIHRNEIENTEE